jgi:hypothetical protein
MRVVRAKVSDTENTFNSERKLGHKMKKQLLAAMTLASLTGSALAADVDGFSCWSERGWNLGE